MITLRGLIYPEQIRWENSGDDEVARHGGMHSLNYMIPITTLTYQPLNEYDNKAYYSGFS